MLKPKAWVATAILTLLAVSDGWADCICTVNGLGGKGYALSMWWGNNLRKYVEDGDIATLYRRDVCRSPKWCWDLIERHRTDGWNPPPKGWVRAGNCQCGGRGDVPTYVGGDNTPLPPGIPTE
jgi:hypothetical protein